MATYEVEFRVSGSTLYADLYIRASVGHQANHTVSPTGASDFSGAKTKHIVIPFNGGRILFDTWSRAVTPGNTYRFAAQGSVLPYDGSRPSINTTFRVPGQGPERPGPLTFSELSHDRARARVSSAPKLHGARLDGYQFNWAEDASFSVNNRSQTVEGAANYLMTGLSANTQHFTRVRALTSAGPTDWSTVTTFTTRYEAPYTPSNVTGVRVSDNQINVSWTRVNPDSSTRRVEGYRVRRWDNVTGAYVEVASLSRTATSFSDTTVRTDRRYRYTVHAFNNGGQSALGDAVTGFIHTTPAAPASVIVQRVGSSIQGVIETGSTVNPSHVVEHSLDGVWQPIPLTSLAAGVLEFTHTSPSAAGSHQYRVKAVAGGLQSAATLSNTVLLESQPAAPTNLGPGVVDARDGVLTYRHNPLDGSAQTAKQMQYRAAGSGTWMFGAPVNSSDQSIPVPGAWVNGREYEWQVRTRGVHPDWSPFSATQTVLTRERPTMTLNSPAGPVHESSRLTVDWGYYDSQDSPQAQYEVALTGSGGVNRTLAGSGTAGQVVFPDRLQDGGAYTLTYRARSGTGLWSVLGVFEFTVQYAKPPQAIITPTWHEDDGYVTLEVGNPEGTPAVVSNDIYRSTLPRDLFAQGLELWAGSGAPFNMPMAWDSYDPPPAGTLRHGDLYHDKNTSTLYQHVDPESDQELGLIVQASQPEPMFTGQYWLNPETWDLFQYTGKANGWVFLDSDDDFTPKVFDPVEGGWVPAGEPPVWELIAEGVPVGGTFPDVTSVTNGIILYRADAATALPSTSLGVVAALSIDSDDLWLSGGAGFGTIARLKWNPKMSFQPGHLETVENRYEGREYPVITVGRQLMNEATISSTLFDGSATFTEVEELFHFEPGVPPILLYRDPLGRKIYCSGTGLKIDQEPSDQGMQTVSFNLRQADYEEGAR